MGIPYSAALTGCKLVFPGPALDGKSVYELIEAEQVTYAAGAHWYGKCCWLHEAQRASRSRRSSAR